MRFNQLYQNTQVNEDGRTGEVPKFHLSPSTLLIQLSGGSQSNVTFAMQQMRRALPQVVVAGIPQLEGLLLMI